MAESREQRALKVVWGLQEHIRHAGSESWNDDLDALEGLLMRHGFRSRLPDSRLDALEDAATNLGIKIDADVVLSLIHEIKERRALECQKRKKRK